MMGDGAYLPSERALLEAYAPSAVCRRCAMPRSGQPPEMLRKTTEATAATWVPNARHYVSARGVGLQKRSRLTGQNDLGRGEDEDDEDEYDVPRPAG